MRSRVLAGLALAVIVLTGCYASHGAQRDAGSDPDACQPVRCDCFPHPECR